MNKILNIHAEVRSPASPQLALKNLSLFKYFDATNTSLLLPGQQLVLKIDERIITQLAHGQVQAQCQMSRNAFRLFFLLLKATDGADYVELLACLHCPEHIFRSLFSVSSYQEITEVLAPFVERWDQYLTRVAVQGQSALEKELKLVRRAVKERNGVNTILKETGFAFTIKAMYRKGYLLERTERQERRQGERPTILLSNYHTH